jgi:DNA-binding PadR family transcriptional regulator
MSATKDTPLTLNEIAILGLLAEKPAYGYELDKLIEARGIRDWTYIAFSSIYAVLTGLEKRRMVISQTELRANRARKLYSITKEGRRTAKHAIKELLATAIQSPDPMMLALANDKMIAEADYIEALRSRLEALRGLKDAAAREGKKAGKGLAPSDTSERAAARLAFEIAFAENLLGERLGPTIGEAVAVAQEPTEQAALREEPLAPSGEPEVIEIKPEPEKPVFIEDEPRDTLF